MYLSRIEVRGENPDARRLLSSPYRVHAAVEGAFAPDAVRRDDLGRILWRLDDAPGGRVWLYIASPSRPSLDGIVDQLGGGAVASGESKDYGPVLNRIERGQVWQFRVKANPARKVFLDKGRRAHEDVVGTIQGHVTEAHQRAWLLDRAEGHGFRVCTDDAGVEQVVVSARMREEFRRGDATVTVSTARYDGLLEVIDAETFRRTLGFGMGRAKSFGCGLMTIAPVR